MLPPGDIRAVSRDSGQGEEVLPGARDAAQHPTVPRTERQQCRGWGPRVCASPRLSHPSMRMDTVSARWGMKSLLFGKEMGT